MPVKRIDWSGALTGRRLDSADLNLKSPLRQSTAGGSGAFLAVGDDDARYWVKPLNNLQNPRVCVNEQIIGRLAPRLGTLSPVVRTMRIRSSFVGWEFRPGHGLQEGIAHACAEVSGAIESRVLDRREKDDNTQHHAEVTALYDWFFGNDSQWLFNANEQERCYSHDHGHYFPGGPAWSAANLEAQVDVEQALPYAGGPFPKDVVAIIADRIEAVTRDDIIAALAMIPAPWPVTDAELETVGFFVERRADAVASRLRAKWGIT